MLIPTERRKVGQTSQRTLISASGHNLNETHGPYTQNNDIKVREEEKNQRGEVGSHKGG